MERKWRLKQVTPEEETTSPTARIFKSIGMLLFTWNLRTVYPSQRKSANKKTASKEAVFVGYTDLT
jgi:hypothetical protein